MKNLPKFKNEKEESEFWENNDSTDYIDWTKAGNATFPNLKPTTKSISIRLPEIMLSRLRQEANRLDVPYQSLLKVIINEGLDRRLNSVN